MEMHWSVEVVYALPDRQVVIPLKVTPGTTVRVAIEQSGILQMFPEVDLTQAKVGIFSKAVALDKVLKAGDRVEIYRPLTIDPKQARMLRVEKERKQRRVKPESPSLKKRG